jgi:tetratricopeptide (TPR) repeat protein
LGLIYLNIGDSKGADFELSQVIASNPDYCEAYFNRGLARLDLANRQGALIDFKEAAKLFEQQGNQEAYQAARAQILLLEQEIPKKSDF